MPPRRSFTIKEKAEIISKLKNGDKNSDLCKEYKVSHSTISTMWKNRDKIIECFESKSLKIKKNRKATHQAIENALLVWFKAQRSQNVPLSGRLLQEKANHFGRLFGKMNFECSENWIYRFRQRHDIVVGKVCGEAASVSQIDCDHRLKTVFPKLTEDYTESQIWNADETDSEEQEHEVGILTEPLTGIQDPLANNPDRCSFCANITKCVDAIDKPYLKNNKMALILNDINVEIDLNDTQKVCLDCDRKLLEMYCFVILVKNAQDTLLNASYDTKETETLVVKTECESPTPDDNYEIDEETKEGIVDSITIDETAFVKNDVFIHKKRKSDIDNKKTSKAQKKRKVDDKVTCESTELMIDIKEEPIEKDDDADTDIHKATDSEDRDKGPDVKPSELDIATNALLNEMAEDGVS